MAKTEDTAGQRSKKPLFAICLLLILASLFGLRSCENQSVRKYFASYAPQSQNWKMLRARKAWYGLGRPPPGGKCAVFKVDAITLARVVGESKITPPASDMACWSEVDTLPDDYVCSPILRGRWADNQTKLVGSDCQAADAHGIYINAARSEVVLQWMTWGD